MKKEEQIAFFDNLAESWDSLHHPDPERLACLAELCGIVPGARLLYVACDTETLIPYLLKKDPASILAVDYSPQMIRRAKEKLSDPRVTFLCTDTVDVGEQDFDCAVIYGAFPHFENRGSIIRHMYRILSPGGRLMICHSECRKNINAGHGENIPAEITIPLPTGYILKKSLEDYFSVDIVVDTDKLYVVSGIKN